MKKYETEMVRPDDVRPGDRLVVSFGIWRERQPAVTQCRWNDAERVLEAAERN